MAGTVGQRARTMAEFRACQQRLAAIGAANAANFAPFDPRPTDVIISPYGKCGTTMLQQLFHTLRTRGDRDFDDISRVVPWIEMGPMLGIDLNAPQPAEPRGFKSHLSYTAVPKGARYIVSLRDPKDAFVSMYHFMEGWFIEPGAIRIEDFFEGWVRGRGAEGGGYWHHLLSWWAVRDRSDVLLLSYADFVRAPVAHIRRIAAFVGVALDPDLLDLTVERSSRQWMLAHKDRFDDAMMRSFSEVECGLPPGSDSAKVRKGGAGPRRSELPPALAERIDRIWAETITPALGFADFAALEAAL